MSALWTLQAMREAMDAETRGAMPHEIVGLSIDSRTIGKGEAYFAIKGDVHDGHSFVAAAIKNGASVLLEGAQGSMLDVDHGTYAFVTSSSTTSGGAAIGVGIAPRSIHAALGIVKAYTTRVGNGPLPTELDEPLGSRIRELGNEFGATTGRPRRCGWFDSVVVRYATRINGLTGLAVTKLDVLDTLDSIAICTAYRIDGELHSDFPGDLVALESAEPQYEWLEGWQKSTADARSLDDLPRAARTYLDRIESLSRMWSWSIGTSAGERGREPVAMTTNSPRTRWIAPVIVSTSR